MNYIEIAKQNLHDEEKLNSLLEYIANDENLSNEEYTKIYETVLRMYNESF